MRWKLWKCCPTAFIRSKQPVYLIDLTNNEAVSHIETTDVYFKKLTDEDISNYLKTREHVDKAGSYGIQGHAKSFCEKFVGDYNNVVGLPIDAVKNISRTKLGFKTCWIILKLKSNQKILAVNKLQPIEKIQKLHAEGQLDFGENYVQEALEKVEKLKDLKN